MGIFGKKPTAGRIRATKAGRVLDDARRDVKRKDEVKAQRDKKNGGKK